MTRYDTVIVGGGVAGIGAGRELLSRGRSVLLVEALPQLGGRARTVLANGLPLDLGCGWFHSARRNSLQLLAEQERCGLDRRVQAWVRQLDNEHFSPPAFADGWRRYEALRVRLKDAPPASDRAADAVADETWRPFLDALSSYVNGAKLDAVSAHDFVAYDQRASEDNWRLPGGLGNFIVGLGRAVPALLGTTVEAVRSGTRLSVETSRGSIEARTAIITVSTDVLAKGALTLPPEADAHVDAAARLPLGHAEKVYLSLPDEHALPAESHVQGRSDTSDTGSYYIRPFGRPIIEGYFGAELARRLVQAGPGAFAAFATEELSACLGSRLGGDLRLLASSRWSLEPTIGGSYSHALPGCADARRTLSMPISDRLCLAGEACSTSDYSTAHGAWDSGTAAARWVDARLASVERAS